MRVKKRYFFGSFNFFFFLESFFFFLKYFFYDLPPLRCSKTCTNLCLVAFRCKGWQQCHRVRHNKMFLHLFMLIVSRGQDFFYTPYILTGIKDNLCCKKVARLNERDIFLRCKVDISVNLYGQNLNQFSDSRSVHPCCNVHMSLNNCDTASSLYSRLAVAARRGRRANTLIIPI